MSTGTEIQVVMPQMGVSVSEGTITKWLKQVGEAVAQDEPLLEISTDKVDTEVPSPGEGVVAQILVAEGQTVDVGTVLATIAPVGAALAQPTAEAPAPVAAAPEPPAPEPPVAEAPVPGPPAPGPPAPEPVAAPAPPSAAAPQAPAPAAGNGKSFVSPVVARIAAEHGVDPGSVPGTGTGGRVTKKDILAFIESGATAAPPPAPAAEPVAAPPPPAAQPAPEPAAPAPAAPATPSPVAPPPQPAAPAVAPPAPAPAAAAPALPLPLPARQRPSRASRSSR